MNMEKYRGRRGAYWISDHSSQGEICEHKQRGKSCGDSAALSHHWRIHRRHSRVVKIGGESLVSNQANSYWRKTLITENEERPSVLSLIGFQRILSDIWGNLGGNLGLMKYHMKALITLRRGLNFLLPLPKPKLSFLSLITSQDFFLMTYLPNITIAFISIISNSVTFLLNEWSNTKGKHQGCLAGFGLWGQDSIRHVGCINKGTPRGQNLVVANSIINVFGPL